MLLKVKKKKMRDQYIFIKLLKINKFKKKELEKNTPETHPSRKDISESIDKIQYVVNLVNERVRKTENINKLVAISKIISVDEEAKIVCFFVFFVLEFEILIFFFSFLFFCRNLIFCQIIIVFVLMKVL